MKLRSVVHSGRPSESASRFATPVGRSKVANRSSGNGSATSSVGRAQDESFPKIHQFRSRSTGAATDGTAHAASSVPIPLKQSIGPECPSV